MRLVTTLLLLCFATKALAQSTYTVDVTGAGDFVDLPSAFAIGEPGDVFLVRPGSYGSATIQRGFSVLCDTGVSVPTFAISNVPSGEVAVVSSLTARDVDVMGCVGAVILQHLDIAPPQSGTALLPALDVQNCADVRVYRSSIRGARRQGVGDVTPSSGCAAVRALGSQLELVRCTLIGGNVDTAYLCGSCGPCAPAGGPGLLLDNASTARVAGCSMFGGRGGYYLAAAFTNLCTSSAPPDPLVDCPAGPPVAVGRGGPAIHVRGNSTVHVVGTPADVLKGGLRRFYYSCASPYGPMASEFGNPILIRTGSQVRISGVTLSRGTRIADSSTDDLYLGGFVLAESGATITQVATPDPFLERIGSGQLDTDVTLRLHSPSGVSAFLDRGRRPLIQPAAGPTPWLVASLATFALGGVPQQGYVDKTVHVSSQDPLGALYLWQGTIDWGNGISIKTNSVPVVVR
jgi:hypothetical protein